MPRVARAWPSEPRKDEEIRLGKPRAVRRQPGRAPDQGPVLKLSGQIRNQRESGLRGGTAFDRSSTAWIQLRQGLAGAFQIGQDETGPAMEPEESSPPPPGGTQAGPAPEPGVNLTIVEIEAMIDGLDGWIGTIAQATSEDLARCNFVDHLVLADARAFRAKLVQEVSRGAQSVTATMREIHAAELVERCAQALSSIRLRTFAVVGVVVAAFGVVLWGLS